MKQNTIFFRILCTVALVAPFLVLSCGGGSEEPGPQPPPYPAPAYGSVPPPGMAQPAQAPAVPPGIQTAPAASYAGMNPAAFPPASGFAAPAPGSPEAYAAAVAAGGVPGQVPGTLQAPQEIKRGSIQITIIASADLRERYLVPVHVFTAASTAAWDQTDVSNYWTNPLKPGQKFTFGQAGTSKRSATFKVPFRDGDKFIVIIADLPGRPGNVLGAADPRMLIVRLGTDFLDPLNPVGRSITVDINTNEIKQR